MTTPRDPDIRTLASSVVYEDSWMALRRVSRREFKTMVLNGTITDDSTVAAYSLLLLHEENGPGGERPPVAR